MLALGAASIAFHARPRLALSLGLDLVLFIIAVMAGRVVPGFTNNAVPGAGARRIKAVETGALGSVLLLLALDFVEAPAAAAVVAFAAAAAVRVLVPIVAPAAYAASVVASAALWGAAFTLFCLTYYPMLSSPRLDGEAG